MILFLNDWKKFPSAVVHTTTSNKSFIRYAGVLKKMGTKNHLWPLALFQPELAEVDPFDPNISDEHLTMVIKECLWNPWYYFREIARFPAKGGGKPIRFKANRGNMSMLWSYFNHIDYCLIMIRQAGKSGSSDQLHNYITNIAGRGATTVMITKDHQLRKVNIERIKAIRDLLPFYLNPTIRDDADNTSEITAKRFNNIILTAVAQANEDRADLLGRGITAETGHYDETAYINNLQITLPVALASSTKARELAEAAGGFYGNIFTTTAGKRDTKHGAVVYNMLTQSMYWNELLLDSVDNKDLIETVKKNCMAIDKFGTKRVMINGTFSHRQIGLSDDWLRQKLAETGATGEAADRDFFNIWTSGSESSPFTTALSTVIRDHEQDPKYLQLTPERYMVRWHYSAEELESKLANNWHVITLDTSQAVGRDSNALTFLDVSDLSVKATSKVSEANILKYAKWVASLLIRYPKTVLVIENASSGQAILDVIALELLSAGEDPVKRIFNRIVGSESGPLREPWEEVQKRRHINASFYTQYKKHFGFQTNGASRKFLYDTVLQQAATSSGHRVCDKSLIDELLSLVVKNERVDHPAGGHDDLCVSWLLGHWFLRYATNLSHYGIPRELILSKVNDKGAVMTDKEIEEVMYRKRVRARYEAIEQEFLNETNQFRKHELARKLTALAKMSLSDGGEPINLDETLEKNKDSRALAKKKRENLDRFLAV